MKLFFVEDFLNGNIVFLMPFDIYGTYKEVRNRHYTAVKEFFGDDMVVEIDEQKRQEQIRKWNEQIKYLENWDGIYPI